MANEEHLKILRQGVEVWNQWRMNNLEITPDLSFANLMEANLSRVDLSKANLQRTCLSGANLREANLILADFSGADLQEAVLTLADLISTNFSEADLSYAVFTGANLYGANFYGASLIETNLMGQDLSEENLKNVNFQNAYLGTARLIDANLDGANLTGACLWETQRAGWSIKDIICEYVYWDSEAIVKIEYAPGEFERLFADQTKICLFYKDGISPLEIASLPALIQHLEDIKRLYVAVC
jgi:hypothetical protein